MTKANLHRNYLKCIKNTNLGLIFANKAINYGDIEQFTFYLLQVKY